MSDADSATFDYHVIEDEEQSDETDYDDNLLEDNLENVDPPASLSSSSIYPGVMISNAVSMLLIMTFTITNKLSGSALQDLLSLIDMHCMVPHRLIKSLYTFKQYFKALKIHLKNTIIAFNAAFQLPQIV